MDFLDELRSFSARVSKLKESISTEEEKCCNIYIPPLSEQMFVLY